MCIHILQEWKWEKVMELQWRKRQEGRQNSVHLPAFLNGKMEIKIAWLVWSPGLEPHVVLESSDLLEEHIAAIFRIEQYANKKPGVCRTAAFSLGLLYDLEDRGHVLPWNTVLSLNYTALQLKMTVLSSFRHENRKSNETAGVSYTLCMSAGLEIFLDLPVQEVMNSLAVNKNITKRNTI